MSIERRMRGRVHYGWIVVAVTFVTLLAAAGIRSAPGVLISPLEREFGWTRATVSFAVSINLPLWSVRAVHRWTDGPTRHPARHGGVARARRHRRRPHHLDDRVVAARVAVGRGGRTRHRHHGIRPRGHGRQSLVHGTPTRRAGPAHGQLRFRAASVPAPAGTTR